MSVVDAECRRFNGGFAKINFLFFYSGILFTLVVSSCKTIKRPLPMEFEEDSGVVSDPNVQDYYAPNFFRTENIVYQDNIKTVLFDVPNNGQNAPASLKLGGKGTLQLLFDDFSPEVKDYFYEVWHCDINWNLSGLSESQYLDGINGLPLLDYYSSTNISDKYFHYQLNIPNDGVQIKRSGNYILNVYSNVNAEKIPILSRRFVVFEQLVDIVPQLRRPSNRPDNATKQEIDFVVNHQNISFFNPHTDVIASVLQNGRWDNAIHNLAPVFIRDHQLVFDFSGKCVFEGGNEFRILDLKSTIGGNQRIEKQKREGNQFEVFLRQDLIRANDLYSYTYDSNGQFVINNWFSNNDHVSSEYMDVHFTLSYENPITDGNIYLNGMFTNWCCWENYKLNYNYQKKAYEKTIKLKQGVYNYEYIFLEDGRKTGTTSLIEGSHFETENEYTILVYYKNSQEIFHKLIGFLNFKTR